MCVVIDDPQLIHNRLERNKMEWFAVYMMFIHDRKMGVVIDGFEAEDDEHGNVILSGGMV